MRLFLCLDSPTVSGRMDYDYPALADPKIGLDAMKEIGSIKKVPLPEELTEQYARILYNISLLNK